MRNAILFAAGFLLATFSGGCGATALSSHTAAARVMVGVHSVAGSAVDAARSSALDRVELEDHASGSERNAALVAEAGRWDPLGATLDAARSSLEGWIFVLRAIHDGVEGAGELWDLVPGILARLLGLWDDAAVLAQSLGMDDFPRIPQPIRLLLSGGAS